MAASGFTPIQLYRTSTALATPSAGNLADGELAINLTDERLYFKNAAGVVKILASNAAAGGTFTSVNVGAGAVGTPSYTFTGDLNTGVWSPGSDIIALSTGGSERLRVDASGNVGIGTASPGARLEVAAASFPYVNIRTTSASDRRMGITFLQSSSAQYELGVDLFGTNSRDFYLNDSAAGAVRLFINSTGNVGINTVSPAFRLDVSGTGRFTGLTKFDSDVELTKSTLNYLYFTDALALARTGVGERVRVDSLGNVGINTVSPAFRLDVSGTGRFTGLTQFDSDVTLAKSTLNYLYFTDALALARTGVGERMRIDSSGNVGIGTSSPSQRLEVDGSIRAGIVNDATLYVAQNSAIRNTSTSGNTMYFDSGVGAGSTSGDFAFRSTASFINSLYINGALGYVGIGTSTPSFQLQLSADSAAKPTTNLWTIASDSRIKTETGEYTKGLDAVCALRPITYRYNGTAGFVDDGKENISIIAQEAMQHFPECVGTFEALLNEGDEEKTELLNWNGHALIFALVNAVKELKAVNDALAARVAQLEGN